jgi:hypothetical protein
MERSRVTRYIRIAVTALSLTACVLLIALWVRSYWIADGFASANSWAVVSLRGELLVSVLDNSGVGGGFEVGYGAAKINEEFDSWNLYAVATPTWNVFFARGGALPGWFHLVAVKFLTLLIIPLVIALSTCPWIHWSRRFSLRTLLIATTLVAVLLGVIVAAGRF